MAKVRLLADATEPPEVTPSVAAAVDIHVAPVIVPARERGEVPPAIGILPVGAVGVGVSERRIVLVDLGLGVGVRTQAAEIVFLLQIVVADEATDLEEEDLLLLALAPGHGRDDLAVDVLGAGGGIDDLLGRAGAIHLDVANDHGADRLDAPLEDSEQLVGEFGLTQHLLNGVRGQGVAALANTGSEDVDDLVDLAVGHLLHGWGHGRHGVILSRIVVLGNRSEQTSFGW